jgi:hypothetical protein
LGTKLTNQNSAREEIKRSWKSVSVYYYKVQNLSSSSLLCTYFNINIYRNIIVSVVLYGCETWSFTKREVRRVRMFDNRELRKIFGPNKDEVKGKWSKLHSKELNDLYSLSNIVRGIKSRRMRWARHVARIGDSRGEYRVLVGKPEGKIPLGKPRSRCEDG